MNFEGLPLYLAGGITGGGGGGMGTVTSIAAADSSVTLTPDPITSIGSIQVDATLQADIADNKRKLVPWDVVGSDVTLADDLIQASSKKIKTDMVESGSYIEGVFDGELIKKAPGGAVNSYFGMGGTPPVGDDCIIFGEASAPLSLGNKVICIGNGALQNTVDSNQVAIGVDCMKGGVFSHTGKFNTAIGTKSMENIFGNTTRCTSVGFRSGIDTQGSECVSIGADSSCGLGTNSVTVGVSSETTFTNSICIGHDAVGTKNNQFVMGNSLLTEIIPQSNGLCDLGTNTNAFKNVQADTFNGKKVNIGEFVGTGSTVVLTNSTVETSLVPTGVGSLTFLANTVQIGDTYRLFVSGNLETDSKDEEITLRLKFGSTEIINTAFLELSEVMVPMCFEIESEFTFKTIGAISFLNTSLKFSYVKDDGDNDYRAQLKCEQTNPDSTVNNTIDLTGEWLNALAGNVISVNMFSLHKIY